MIITTSICANYLPKACALGRSIKRHLKDATFVVCLTEREIPDFGYKMVEDGAIDAIVLSKDLGLNEDFNRFMFKHKIVEASTAVKGFLMKHLMARYTEDDQFVYLDPDCIVFSDFVELRELLSENPIVLVPHLMAPGHIDMEISSLKYGIYQLGFLAVSRSEEADRFVNWWADRLYLYCYDDLSNGLFTDQRWADLAPTFFNVKTLHHYGYDFGTWAVKDVEISNCDGLYYINEDPLRFAHFSGYDGGTIHNLVMKWWLSEKNEACYREMIDWYTNELEECGQSKYGKYPWSYATYESGEKIEDTVRVTYRTENQLRWNIDDPYRYGNKKLCHMMALPYVRKEPKWATLFKKAIDVWVQEGFFAMVKKTVKKLFGR